MREILFRGKRTDNGEWVEGCLITSDVCLSECTIGYLSSELHHIDEEDVEAETVGQYTGLTDKNGKEIFEGDIVFYEYEYVSGVINWDKQSARFIIDFDTWCTDFDSVFGGEIEVVGNIHDNPELLGGINNEKDN